jgi:hypothetical protein
VRQGAGALGAGRGNGVAGKVDPVQRQRAAIGHHEPRLIVDEKPTGLCQARPGAFRPGDERMPGRSAEGEKRLGPEVAGHVPMTRRDQRSIGSGRPSLNSSEAVKWAQKPGSAGPSRRSVRVFSGVPSVSLTWKAPKMSSFSRAARSAMSR